MSTDIAAPPFALDVRVARSPLVGLRYGVDGRTTDIDGVIERLQTARAAADAEREELRRRLRPYEESRRAILERVGRTGGGELLARLDEGLELHAELARLDERVACLTLRIDALREQRATLRRLSGELGTIDWLHDASIDGPGAVENQAVRQLFHLIDVDHEATAQHILEGPMQVLADAGLQTELLGRAVGTDLRLAAQGAATCKRSTDAALQELTRVIAALDPHELHESGVGPAVRGLVDDLSGVEHQVLVLGKPRRLRPGVEMALFRIVQEALANAVAHGHPSAVEVVLLFQPQRVAAVVRDDGEGFDVAATEARLGRSSGLGLITMRQRAQVENGHVDVRSVVGDGTEIRATFNAPD